MAVPHPQPAQGGKCHTFLSFHETREWLLTAVCLDPEESPLNCFQDSDLDYKTSLPSLYALVLGRKLMRQFGEAVGPFGGGVKLGVSLWRTTLEDCILACFYHGHPAS